jgi:hypothetical protein
MVTEPKTDYAGKGQQQFIASGHAVAWPSSHQQEDTIFKHINGFGTNKNVVTNPKRTWGQE